MVRPGPSSRMTRRRPAPVPHRPGLGLGMPAMRRIEALVLRPERLALRKALFGRRKRAPRRVRVWPVVRHRRIRMAMRRTAEPAFYLQSFRRGARSLPRWFSESHWNVRT